MPTTRGLTDLVEELVLRRWARQHYVPSELRDSAWHPVVLDEMRLRDHELHEAAEWRSSGRRIVPLMPDVEWTLHSAHVETQPARVLLQVPELPTH